MDSFYHPSLKKHINKLQNDHQLTFRDDKFIAVNNHLKTYSSIQLITETCETNPLYAADHYFQWLASTSRGLIRVEKQESTYKIYFCLVNKPLLTFTLKESDGTVAVFLITGGLLARQNQKGTFSFLRTEDDKAEYIIALEQFKTRLPWFLYRLTQAPIHEMVMSQYQKNKGR